MIMRLAIHSYNKGHFVCDKSCSSTSSNVWKTYWYPPKCYQSFRPKLVHFSHDAIHKSSSDVSQWFAHADSNAHCQCSKSTFLLCVFFLPSFKYLLYIKGPTEKSFKYRNLIFNLCHTAGLDLHHCCHLRGLMLGLDAGSLHKMRWDMTKAL